MSNVYAFQDKLEREVSASLGADRRTMLQLPTGGGKTAVALRIARLYLALGLRVWFLCHRRELLAQACARFEAEGIAHGVIQAGKPMDAACAMQIGSIDSVRCRWESFEAPDLIVWDEAHRMASPSWLRLADRFPMARHLGLSATPERLDGKPLGEFFAGLVCGPQTAELEAAGALAHCRVFAPSRPDLDGLRIVAGDYQRDGLAERMADRTLIGDAVAHYLRLASGRPALVFASSVAHSKAVVKRFRAEEIAAEHVDYQTGDAARADALRRLAAGELKILSSVELFTEGLDISDIGAVILLRPTRSLRLFLQMVGRGRRISQAWPDLVVLDHAGLAYEHGHPNADREWSLTLSRAKRRASAPPLWRCPECSAVHSPAAQCPECGHAYRVACDGQPEAGGELVEWNSFPETESISEFAARVGMTNQIVYNWKKKGLPRIGSRIKVVAAVKWLAARGLGRKQTIRRSGNRGGARPGSGRKPGATQRKIALTPKKRGEAIKAVWAAMTPKQRVQRRLAISKGWRDRKAKAAQPLASAPAPE